MNVSGIEWRGPDPRDGKYASQRPPRRAQQPVDPDEDVVEIHGQSDEEETDGLDDF